MTFNAYPIGHNEICFGTYDIPGANAGLRNLAQAVFFVLIVRLLIIVVIGLNICGGERLALKGPASPAELGLKNAIESSARDLRDKMIICRGC